MARNIKKFYSSTSPPTHKAGKDQDPFMLVTNLSASNLQFVWVNPSDNSCTPSSFKQFPPRSSSLKGEFSAWSTDVMGSQDAVVRSQQTSLRQQRQTDTFHGNKDIFMLISLVLFYLQIGM